MELFTRQIYMIIFMENHETTNFEFCFRPDIRRQKTLYANFENPFKIRKFKLQEFKFSAKDVAMIRVGLIEPVELIYLIVRRTGFEVFLVDNPVF